MIGVIPKAEQGPVVEEFFELFKTPWELYRPGRAYDVIIATADEVPEVQVKLLLVCGAASKNVDARLGLVFGPRYDNAMLRTQEATVPIYRGLLTFELSPDGVPCIKAGAEIAGVRLESPDSTVIRLGFDPFDEVEFLLSSGQPVENASIPTLDLHIAILRDSILQAEISLLEIPPVPAGYEFAVCLTHDIDFVGIRQHWLEHTMWGFLYRATVGSLRDFLRRRLPFSQVLRNWCAVASLPFVRLGWANDFWEPFEWYLRAERGLPATYFLIPFKRKPGDNVPGPHASRRATGYDISDVSRDVAMLQKYGCELGVHGIDAWHCAEKGRAELARIAEVSGSVTIGNRIHWLLRNEATFRALETAGYDYDSTVGYNETVGYRAGTSQVFRPLGAQTLLELPLHIQDGALFFPQRLGLSEPDAERRCRVVIDNARRFGGVLTLLWHDRSHAPERFWGDFYLGLLDTLKSSESWFGTGTQVVRWFQKRREVHFERNQVSDGARTLLNYQGEEIRPPLKVRIHTPAGPNAGGAFAKKTDFVDIPWNGKSVDQCVGTVALSHSVIFPEPAHSSTS